MTAYIYQPSGKISISILDEMLIDRFSYVRTLELNSALPDDKKLPMPKVCPEYLCAGSAKDNASHFLLRLASALASSEAGAALRRTVAVGETLMWRDRLATATPAATRALHAAFRAEVFKETARLENALRQFNDLDKVGVLRDRYLRFLMDLSVFLKDTESWHKDHAISYHSNEDCDKHTVSVPWRLVKPLVRRSRIHLSAGRAELRCSTLMSVLDVAFAENLRLATETLMVCGFNPPACNAHLLELADKMAALCSERPVALPSSGLKASEVVGETQFFPPCMKHAFDQLLQEHNCHHDTRYQLTLFLKSVGMSLEEQLSFWRSEYSQPAPSLGNRSKWNERRYVYSIRHAYGLEGKRVQQEGWGCVRIQNKSSKAAGPNCPFLLPAPALSERFPELAELLPAQSQSGPSSNFGTLSASSCSNTCQAFLCGAKRCGMPMTQPIKTPAQYYLKNKDLLDW